MKKLNITAAKELKKEKDKYQHEVDTIRLLMANRLFSKKILYKDLIKEALDENNKKGIRVSL